MHDFKEQARGVKKKELRVGMFRSGIVLFNKRDCHDNNQFACIYRKSSEEEGGRIHWLAFKPQQLAPQINEE